jgi:hypothetical protein
VKTEAAVSDPVRLVSSTADAAVRDLLRDARRSAPPELKERAIATTLQVLAAPAVGVGAKAAGAKAWSLTVHWVGVAGVVGVCTAAAMGVRYWLSDSTPVPSLQPIVAHSSGPRSPSSSPESVGVVEPSTSSPSQGWSPVAVEVTSLPPAPEQTPTAPTGPAAAAPPPVVRAEAPPLPAPSGESAVVPPASAVAPAAPKLEPEIVSLDLSRKALAEGDGRRAMSLLHDYYARFPAGALRAEATILRIEAFMAVGQRADAVRLGHSVITSDPDGPYVARIRSLLGETDP